MITNIDLDTTSVSLGPLLGTTGSNELLKAINERCGSGSYFGNTMNQYAGAADPLRAIHDTFMQQVVEPIRELKYKLSSVSAKIEGSNVIRPIDTVDELAKGIPPSMHNVFLYAPEVKQMLCEERIDGFGVKYDQLDEDPYESICSSAIEVTSADVANDGSVTMTELVSSRDPLMTDDEKDAIRRTRDFVTDFYNDTKLKVLDITAYPDLHH